jgi:DNA-cytosine methyltransferase
MGLEKKLNVLSLFDGMSGTQMALKNLGIKVDKYYASEIDKYAIQITRKNFPDTIHLGDVKDIKGEDFIRDIDLVVAGSPCQGFSFAGKQLAFDDERSALFFEFIRILREVKPKYFLLENVRMKKEFQDVISEQISSVYPEYTSGGLFSIEPILINSALVSAQNRNRLYWTNIPNIEQPEDLGIVLRDVLDEFPSREFYAGQELQKNYKGGNQLNPKYKSQANTLHDIDKKSPTISAGTHGYANGYISEKANEELKKMTTKDGKSYALTATYQGAVAWNSIEKKQRTMIPTYNTPKQVGVAADLKGYDIIKRVYSENGKSPTLTTMGGGHREPKVAVKSMTEVRTPEANKIRREHKKKTGKDWSPRHMRHLVERKDDKSNTITANTSKQHTIQIEQEEELTWRKLTPLECERLQTFPDNYSEGVSNTQRYKMLGNGFTVRVIEHILKNMEI